MFSCKCINDGTRKNWSIRLLFIIFHTNVKGLSLIRLQFSKIPRLSLQNRIFLFAAAFVITAFLVVVIVIRPRYEQSVIEERVTIVQQLQDYTLTRLDDLIGHRVNIGRFVSGQIAERGRDMEALLQNIMMINPDIIMLSLESSRPGDKLTLRSSSYPEILLSIDDSLWMRSRDDSLTRVSWVRAGQDPYDLLVTKTRFTLGTTEYWTTILWNAKALMAAVRQFPLGDEYSLSITGPSFLIFRNVSTFQPLTVQESLGDVIKLRTVEQEGKQWRLVAANLRTIPARIITAIPESVIAQPVEEMFYYTITFLLVATVVLLLVGWIVARQISKPISRLVQDVERLTTLDFQQAVMIPALPELRIVGETIESMRQVLDRYKRLNVEKIIFEEWKNRFLMTHSEDMMGITDSSGRFVFQNQRFVDFQRQLSPTDPIEMCGKLLNHSAIKKIKETNRTEQTDNFVVKLHQSELQVKVREDDVQFFRLQDVSIVRALEELGSLLIFHDLTPERLLEKAKSDMINIIIHELRNPVAGIKGLADVLIKEQELSDQERREFLRHIKESSESLNTIINRFLDLKRLESRKTSYRKQPTQLGPIIRSVAEAFRPQLMSKNLTIDLKIETPLPDVPVAPDLFRDAINNLLSNAIKYGERDRVIAMQLRRSNEHAEFSIVDHGYGIPAEAQERLFTEFYRVQGTRASREVGTGLGLAHVKEIMAQHSGSVSLESDSTIGCRFTLLFPIAGGA